LLKDGWDLQLSLTTKSVSERILEMGQHLAKLETSIVALFPDML